MMIMVCSCLALLMPMGVSAHTNVTYSTSADADGFCHCGYPREKTWIYKVDGEKCPIKGHGLTCELYVSKWKTILYYCTNEKCGDDYQDPWIFIEYQHL